MPNGLETTSPLVGKARGFNLITKSFMDGKPCTTLVLLVAQAGITNCRSFLEFLPTGGMSGVNPAHTSLALLKEAEEFVASEKKLEAMQEAARVAAA
jgi:hypothetical protein